MNIAFHWTRGRMDLITKLLGVLSGTLHEWNTFNSPGGDVDYLSDIGEVPNNLPQLHHLDRAGQSLRTIKKAFGKLENDRQRLISLKESLSSDFSTVRHTFHLLATAISKRATS